MPSRRERFDGSVARIVAGLEARWPHELADVEFAVEDVPWVDEDWRPERVPIATLIPGASRRRPPRIVVYRLPIQARARRSRTAPSQRELIHAALVDRVAELLDRPAEEISEGYSRE